MIFGLVPVGAINGILFSVAIWVVASTFDVVDGPTRTFTLSVEISFVAELAASDASDFVSATTSVIFLPFTPPPNPMNPQSLLLYQIHSGI